MSDILKGAGGNAEVCVLCLRSRGCCYQLPKLRVLMGKNWQKREVCVLLPNKEHLDFAVGMKARGQEVLSRLSELLGVTELHLFGLSIVRDNEYLFLDLEQKLSKYFVKEWKRRNVKVPFLLFLRVQYYVESGRLISNSKVQHLYYADLRQKVLRSRSRHQEALFFQLAASALQAELGDKEQIQSREEGGERGSREEKYRPYFLPEDYFPSWLIKRRGRDYLLLHTPTLHSELRSVPRNRAILQFIKEASTLQDGPITFYCMRQEKKEMRSCVLLGLALKGVYVYQDVEGIQSLLYDFSWTDIDRFTFQGRRFEIHTIGSLCLPKLVYYTPSALHSKHILRHLSDSHRFHINTRDTVDYLRQLEERHASQLFKEAYICDRAGLNKKLRSASDGESLTSSVSNYSISMATLTAKPMVWPEGEEEGSVIEVELCVDEPEEVAVDDPDEFPWLAELSRGVSVDGPVGFQSFCWADVTMEMKEVLNLRAQEGTSVD